MLRALHAVKDVNDPNAQIILWRLGLDHRLTEAEVQMAARFLASTNADIFSAGAECVQQSNDDATLDRLRAVLDSPEVFRVYRAAAILHHKGESAGLDRLAEMLRDQATDAGVRRDLARRLLGTDPHHMFPVYLDLLDDPNPWVRYHAFNSIRKFSGDVHDYDYERREGNQHAVDALRKWYAAHGQDLPREEEKDLAEQFSGIGAVIRAEAGGARVVSVTGGLGADRAGVQAGDLIVAVNGHPTAEKTLRELATYELRGREGSTVDVVFISHATGITQAAVIVRRRLMRGGGPGP